MIETDGPNAGWRRPSWATSSTQFNSLRSLKISFSASTVIQLYCVQKRGRDLPPVHRTMSPLFVPHLWKRDRVTGNIWRGLQSRERDGGLSCEGQETGGSEAQREEARPLPSTREAQGGGPHAPAGKSYPRNELSNMLIGFPGGGFCPETQQGHSFCTVGDHSKAPPASHPPHQAPLTLEGTFVLELLAAGQGPETGTQPFQAIYWKDVWFPFRPCC